MAKTKSWHGPLYRRVGVNETQSDGVRSLSPLQFRIWAEARLGIQSAIAGLGRFSIGSLAEELSISIDEAREEFDRVCDRLGWIYDGGSRWLLQPNALQVAWDRSPSVYDGWRREAKRQGAPDDLLARLDAIAAGVRGGVEIEERAITPASPATSRGTSPIAPATSEGTSPPTSPETSGGIEHVPEYEYELEGGHTPSSPLAPCAAGSAESFAQLWNEVNANGPFKPVAADHIPDKWVKHIGARLKDYPLQQWQVVFERMKLSAFLRGEDGGWCASFDWIIKSQENAVKVLAGKYDGRKAKPQVGQTGAAKPGKYGHLVVSAPSGGAH